MSRLAQDIPHFPLILLISLLIIFTFGVLINFILLIILCRFRKTTDAFITTGILQTVIDWLVCLIYVTHVCLLQVDVQYHVISVILCRVIYSDALLWGLIAVRLNTSMLTAFFYFIQFVFPFMRIEQRKKTMNSVIGVSLVLSGLLGSAPHTFFVHTAPNSDVCLRDMGEDFLVPSRAMIALRLVILLGLVYNFLVPVGTAIYLYHHVLLVLRFRDKSQSGAAWKEMRLNAMHDVWLQAVFSVLAVSTTFLKKYPNPDSVRMSVAMYWSANFLLCVYSVVYPCISIVFRRKYHKPILECLIQMGMHPTDSWLAQRWSVANVDRNKMSYTQQSSWRRTTQK